MAQKYVKKTDRQYTSHKSPVVPEKFRTGFLATIDGRTDLAKSLRSNYDAIVRDIGGSEDLSRVKSALVERFVWLEAILRGIEADLGTGKADKGESLGRWVQAVNSLSGLARVLGVDRVARNRPWIEVGTKERVA